MTSFMVGSTLVAPTVATYGGVLAAGLGGIVLAERGRIRRLAQSSLFVRWGTWAVIAPLFVTAALVGEPLLAIVVAAGAAVALLEYARLMHMPRLSTAALVLAGVALIAVAAAVPGSLITAAFAAALFAGTVAALDGRARAARGVGVTVVGLVYVPLLLAHALLMRDLSQGTALLLMTGLAVALSDIGAFVAGKALGGPKLAPRLSPNKTWAGALGNLIGASVAVMLSVHLLDGVPAWWIAGVPPVVGVSAIAGDLFESLLKRRSGVKDAGSWLPGFGGLLDRIDSLLFVLPAVYGFALIGL
jgi:phosphatidate cytidylyltransferase